MNVIKCECKYFANVFEYILITFDYIEMKTEKQYQWVLLQS